MRPHGGDLRHTLLQHFLAESRPVKVVKLSWFQVCESGPNQVKGEFL